MNSSVKNNRVTVVICLLLSLFLLGNASKSFAQLATVNSSKVLSSIPEIKKMDSLVLNKQQSFAKAYNDKYDVTKRLLSIADSLQKISSTSAETVVATTKFKKAQKDLSKFEEEANKEVKEYSDSLMQPFYDRISTAIKVTAQNKSFKQVIDVQQVTFLYIDPTTDITEDVIVELKK